MAGKLVIRNIGLILSGKMEEPILDGDCVIAEDGIIKAIGYEKDLNCEDAQTEIVIPDEPGTLAAAAQVAGVDTITAGEADLVVVDGDTVPTDARAGARALETWLGGGTPSTTWETFTSDDPDQDGWRWAAISQKTGTVATSADPPPPRTAHPHSSGEKHHSPDPDVTIRAQSTIR